MRDPSVYGYADDTHRRNGKYDATNETRAATEAGGARTESGVETYPSVRLGIVCDRGSSVVLNLKWIKLSRPMNERDGIVASRAPRHMAAFFRTRTTPILGPKNWKYANCPQLGAGKIREVGSGSLGRALENMISRESDAKYGQVGPFLDDR